MALPTPKELKALAKACREAGIKQFKGEGIEFTLTEDAPPSKPRGKAAAKALKPNHDDGKAPDTKEIEMSEEDLLFWSASGGMPLTMTGGGQG